MTQSNSNRIPWQVKVLLWILGIGVAIVLLPILIISVFMGWILKMGSKHVLLADPEIVIGATELFSQTAG